MTEQTDRELIELAAKAYGEIPIPLVWIRPFDNELTPINNRGEPWNPLNDDGDALRLAVDLDLAIVPYPIYNKQKHSVLVQKKNLDESRFEKMELHGDDPRAATRRAITRAAAAIGETMP